MGLSVGDVTGIGSVADLAKTVVDKIWPDKTEIEKAQLAGALALVQGQLEINKAEAASSSAFTSGWRPFVGWVCGMGCAWNWIGLPITLFVCELLGKHVAVSPADISQMMPLLTGLLGLGALRSFDKLKGTAS
jgi:hypothetical protein